MSLYPGWRQAGGISKTEWAKQYKRDQAINQVMTNWQTAYDEAKNVNLQRYDEILKGYNDRYSAGIEALQGLGDAEKANLQHSYNILGSQQQQALVNNGLASTTIRPSVMQQNTNAMNRAMSSLNERLQYQYLSTMNQLSGDTLGFMERREDEYPDLNYYLELLKQAGAS